MDDAEKAARIAELETELAVLTIDCQRLGDELHRKRNRLQVLTLQISSLRKGLEENEE